MTDRLQKDVLSFKGLSSNNKLLFIQAFLLLPIVNLSIKLFGFNRVYRFMYEQNLSRSNKQNPLSEEKKEVTEIVEMVKKVHWRVYKGITCLPKNLVMWWMLGKKGIKTRLIIGVKKSEDGIIGHAWLEYNTKVINEKQSVVDEYTVIQEFN